MGGGTAPLVFYSAVAIKLSLVSTTKNPKKNKKKNTLHSRHVITNLLFTRGMWNRGEKTPKSAKRSNKRKRRNRRQRRSRGKSRAGGAERENEVNYPPIFGLS